MLVKTMPIAELKPADYNPRKDLQPGDAEYEKLKRSLTEFGYVEPVIWNSTTGHVVGGHQRLKVLEDLGHNTVDVIVVELDETREKALNIALNKISGEWDNDKFSNEYKKVHGKEQFDNDWYEYIEYGTTKQETILLQRLGFTRESATYIRTNVFNAIFLHEGKPYLNPILLESSNINVRKEANEIRYNVPEAFSMPAFMF